MKQDHKQSQGGKSPCITRIFNNRYHGWYDELMRLHWKIDVETAQFLPRRSNDPEPSPYGLLHMFILEAERDAEKGKEKIQHILSLHVPR